MPKIFEKLNDPKIIIKVYQQCLEEQNDKLSIFYKNAKIDFEIFNFTDQIVNYYTKANLVITRAGASVLGELINFNNSFYFNTIAIFSGQPPAQKCRVLS